MNATIVELETTVHQKVQKLLPFEDTLSGTERRMVEEHAATCAQCQDDLLFQRRLRHVQPAAGAAPDMEAALARVMPKLSSRPKAAIHWTRWALAAQLLLIAGLGLQVMKQQDQYRLLGSAAASPEANVIVQFRPETSEHQLRAILGHTGARVVGGPTETQAWLLNVAPARLDSAVSTLRAEPAVQMAEPLQAPK